MYLWDDNVSVCVSPGGYHLCICGMTTLVCVCHLWDDNVNVCVCHLVVTTCVSVG